MILQLLIAMIATRLYRHQDHVIRYLPEENRILKAKLKGHRIPLTDTERRRLVVLAHPIERKHLKELLNLATPDTLQRWYHRLVVQAPSRTPQGKPLERPRVAAEIEQLVMRMANENPRWGYRRIQGVLSNLSYHIDNTTVRNIICRNHTASAPIRGSASMSWSQFLRFPLELLQTTGFFESGDSMRNMVHDLRLPLFAMVGVRNWLIPQSRDSAKRFAEPIASAWGIATEWVAQESDKPKLAAHFESCRQQQTAGIVLLAEGKG